MIITQSIIGAAVIWGFITLSADEATVEQKIYKNGVLLYLALTMMVSYSFLSIKTAAPIWFIFGALLSGAATKTVQFHAHSTQPSASAPHLPLSPCERHPWPTNKLTQKSDRYAAAASSWRVVRPRLQSLSFRHHV